MDSAAGLFELMQCKVEFRTTKTWGNRTRIPKPRFSHTLLCALMRRWNIIAWLVGQCRGFTSIGLPGPDPTTAGPQPGRTSALLIIDETE